MGRMLKWKELLIGCGGVEVKGNRCLREGLGLWNGLWLGGCGSLG
jgi:hypothetical protein